MEPNQSRQRVTNGLARDPAERQANEIGARIGADLPPTPISSGPIPKPIRAVAERHIGVNLSGTHLRSGTDASRIARESGALAVAEGISISFKDGQLTTSTAAGRALLGHELVHVGQQRLSGRAARQLQPDDTQRAAIVKALHTRQIVDMLSIKDVQLATVDERAQLIGILNSSNPPSQAVLELQIRYWHSFGDGLGDIVLNHPVLWSDAHKQHPVLSKILWDLPPCKKLASLFVADLESIATQNLFANRGYLVARAEMLGLSGPSPNALTPDLLTRLRVNLQDEAYKVYQLRQKQKQLGDIQIGYSGDGMAIAKVHFDPLRPPESISMFRRRASLFETTVRPEWSSLKLIWDVAQGEIGRVAAQYPEIYSALATGDEALLGLARVISGAFGANAKALLDAQIGRVEAAQKLLNEHSINMLDLKLLVSRLMKEPGVTTRNWTAGFENIVALQVVRAHTQFERDISELLDGVQTAAMVATIIPGVGVAGRLVAGGIAVGVQAARGASEWDEGQKLGQLARATPLSGTELVDQTEADKVRSDGVLKMIDAAVNAALLGVTEVGPLIVGALSRGLRARAAQLRTQHASKVSGNTHLEDQFAKVEEKLKDPPDVPEATKQLDNLEAELAAKETQVIGDVEAGIEAKAVSGSGESWGIPEGGIPAKARMNQPGVTVPDYVAKNPELYYFKPGAQGKPGHYYRRKGFPERTSKGHEIPCFTAGTLVATPAGPRSIESLRVGDIVTTFDERSNRTDSRPILECHRSTTDWLYHVATGSGLIAATGEHRFYIGGETWECARDLMPGDELRAASGCRRQVQRVTIEEIFGAETFNLAVADHHNFFVGEDEILVHNSGPYGIYYGIEPKTGEIIYVGQTSQDLAVRQAQHQAEGRAIGTETPWKKDMRLRWATGPDGQPLTGLSEVEANYWERLTYDKSGGKALRNRQVPYTDEKMAAAIEAHCPK